MKLYKLTNAQGQTYGGTQWGENVTHTAPGVGPLGSAGWIHAYTSPLLAVLLNPIHANFQDPILWLSEGVAKRTDHGLRVGCTTLTTIRKVSTPKVSITQRVRFGILCAEACKEPEISLLSRISARFTSRTSATNVAKAASTAWATWADRANNMYWAAYAAEWAAWAKTINLVKLAKQAMRTS